MKPEEKPNLCDCERHLPCRHCQEPKASPAIYGQLIEIGSDLDGQPMLIIHTTKEAIKAFTGSMLYREVAVMPVERAETGDSAPGLEAARSEIQRLLDKYTGKHAECLEEHNKRQQDQASGDAEAALRDAAYMEGRVYGLSKALKILDKHTK